MEHFKIFVLQWFKIAGFLIGCYLLTYPLNWYSDWLFSGSFERAVIIWALVVATISAGAITWVFWLMEE